MIADIILVLFIIACAFAGKRRGLVGSLLGLISFGAAILITMIITPPIAKFIETTPFYESLYKTVTDIVNEKILSGDAGSLVFFAGNAVSLGLTALTDVVASSLLTIALSILLFVCVSIILRLLARVLDGVLRLPVLKFVNSIGGFAFGIAKGLVIAYICLAVWGVLTLFNAPALLEGSTLLSSMFKNNILLIAFK